MNFPTPKDQLKHMLNVGLLSDIFFARQSHALLISVGHRGPQIEGQTYTRFFSNLQSILADHLIVHVTKLFEPPSDRYPNISVPSVLRFIELSRNSLEIIEKGLVHQNLSHLRKLEAFVSLSDPAITDIIIHHFNSTLPTIGNSPALSGLKVLRDKRIAHREATDISAFPTATYKECIELVTYAEDFMCVVGPAYIGTFYGTAGEDFLIADDARMAQNSVEHLLEYLIKNPETRGA